MGNMVLVKDMGKRPGWVRFVENLCTFIDGLNALVGKGISWISALLVLIVAFDVVLRYLFRKSLVAVQEMEWHLFAILFLLGAGHTLMKNGHVRVDVIYQRLSRRNRAFVNVLGCLIFLFPGCYLVIETSLPFVMTSWSFMEGSPDPGGLPYRFLLKAAIPAGFFLVALQGMSMFFKNLLILLGLRQGARS